MGTPRVSPGNLSLGLLLLAALCTLHTASAADGLNATRRLLKGGGKQGSSRGSGFWSVKGTNYVDSRGQTVSTVQYSSVTQAGMLLADRRGQGVGERGSGASRGRDPLGTAIAKAGNGLRLGLQVHPSRKNPKGIPLPCPFGVRGLYVGCTWGVPQVYFSGVTWSGFETPIAVAHGLQVRKYTDHLDQMKALGFNMIRLAFAGQTLQKGTYPNGNIYGPNPELRVCHTPRTVLYCTVLQCTVIDLPYFTLHSVCLCVTKGATGRRA